MASIFPALFHGSALRSTVNGDLVRDVTLTPCVYGAEYGRSLGGTVRVDTRDLPTSGVHGYLQADTLDTSGMVSAAVNDRVRVAIAGRYGWLDCAMKLVDAPDVGDAFRDPLALRRLPGEGAVRAAAARVARRGLPGLERS